MKVFLDEGVPRRLAKHLQDHDVTTVAEAGWSGIKNGVLLSMIEWAGYRAFVSCDQNLVFQQNELERRPFAILILSTNHLPTMEPHFAKIAEAVDRCQPGEVETIECGKFVPSKFRPKPPQP